MSGSRPTRFNDTLFGTANNDAVDLLSGNDLYYGLDGDDSILADSGLDTVFGGNGADTIVGIAGGILDGGAGNDVLIASGVFFDTPLAGGAGDDRYIMSGSTLYLSINDSSGNDTLSYAEVQQKEVLVPYLVGVAGIEAFDLSGSVDILHLDGASVRRLSDTDVVTIFGGGADRLVLDDLASWTRGEASGGFVTFTTAIGGNATVIAAESLVPITSGPTAGNDTLFGSEDDDVVNLLAGNDFYRDFSGRDSVLGGNGNDSIWGGADEDTLDGGEGNDQIIGQNNDSLEGGGGDDFLLSGALYDSDRGVFRMSGGAGNDYIYSEGLGDTLDGGIGDDTIIGVGRYFSYGAGPDSILGGGGNDNISGGGGSTMVGGEGDDSLYGDEGGRAAGAVFDGGAGNDRLVGDRSGNHSMDGGAGNDTLAGNIYDDLIDGGLDTDLLSYADIFGSYWDVALPTQAVTVDLVAMRAWGDAGNDTITGIENVVTGSGSDRLRGDELANFLSAGFGNDTIIAGGGDDTLVGGGDSDLYIISGAIGSVTIDERLFDFINPGFDTVSLAGSVDQEIQVNELGQIAGIEAFNLGGGGNVLHLNGASVRRLSDTDVVQVFGSGADRIVFDDLAIWTRDEASDGFVTFTTSVGGNATVIAAEALVLTAPEPPTEILDSVQDDVVALRLGITFYEGLTGHDSILGTTGAETIHGDGGDDTLHGNSGTDLLDGGAGNDMLMTNGLSGHLSGGAGDDVILVGDVTLTDIVALFGPQWF